MADREKRTAGCIAKHALQWAEHTVRAKSDARTGGASCRRLQSSAAVLANRRSILLTICETEQMECSRFVILCSQSCGRACNHRGCAHAFCN
jgi:hypothetical protein